MSDKEQALLPLFTEQSAILARCGSAFCHAVDEKFNCMAILRNIEEAGSFSNTSGVFRAEKRYSTKVSSRVEISVWKDDLTRHKVDAVVNAANEMLQHGGGLAQALSKAGGPVIQKWSDDVTKHYGKVPVGEAVLGPAGDLPCTYIIHAVGPCVSPNPTMTEIEKASFYLHKAITKILEITVLKNISSVAIPALSSGLFNFPRDRCADIIVKAIKQVQEFTGFQGKHLDIRLINNDEPSVREMERATRMIFDPSSISGSNSGAVQGSMISSNAMQFGNTTLHLKKGAIEEERVDVIVNTIAADCNLSLGLISKAILKKAGGKIQEDIDRKKKTNLTNVHVTKGYNLNCQLVYHTVCEHRSQFQATKVLFEVVSDCLRKASYGYTSISFPAIGTGHLGFKKQEVAGIMMDAVAEFAKVNTAKLDVNFVVFPKDNDMMEAFENEMKKRKKAKSPEVYKDTTIRFPSEAKETKTETPCVEFQNVSNEALREAKEWACRMLQLSKTKTIKNNHFIHFGQKEHENLLSFQMMFDVQIEEFFKNGNGGITITGSSLGVSCAAIEVESMLCRVQEEFARAEEQDILYCVVRWSCKDEPWIQTPEISAVLEKAYLAGEEKQQFKDHLVNFFTKTVTDIRGSVRSIERKCLLDDAFVSLKRPFYARTHVTRNDPFEKEVKKAFVASRLHIVKTEKLENVVLKQLFEKNGQRVKGQPKRLYQRVSAQYCDLICRVGFQKEFAPPPEQRYGSGIYFSSSVEGALKLWNDLEQEQYIYIIQAKVLTGKSTIGSTDIILPPPLNGDPLERYDSVSNMGETHVIFSGQQALPEYLIICGKSSSV